MNYYIFRHAESYFSKHGLPYGNKIKSADILVEGIPSTKRIGEYLAKKEINAYFSSPYKRCSQTAEIIEKITGKKFVVDKRIGEEAIYRKKETFEEFVNRLDDFVEYLKSHKYRSVAICSHGWPIAALTALATKGEVKLEDLNIYPHPGILIEIKNKKIKYLNFNN